MPCGTLDDVVNGGIETRDGYARLLLRNIWERKAEFFVGLFLSIVTGALTSWLQYREGMLDERQVWGGVVTTAIPIFGLVIVFALIEVGRAAVLLHREQRQAIASLAKQLAALGTSHAATATCLEVAYASRVMTYVSSSDEEEYDELEEYITFRNVGAEIIRRITVDPFTILGQEHAIAIVPTLAPGDAPAERRLKLKNLRDANVKLKAFHKVPVGVSFTVHYFGATDTPQYSGRHALIYDRSTILVEPYVAGVVSDFKDASEPPPASSDD